MIWGDPGAKALRRESPVVLGLAFYKAGGDPDGA
jgi:hypothetical protein